MNAMQMIELMNRVPFAPLELHLSDGTTIQVEEPFQIATKRNGSSCIIYTDDDRMRVVSYGNITEVITAATTD